MYNWRFDLRFLGLIPGKLTLLSLPREKSRTDQDQSKEQGEVKLTSVGCSGSKPQKSNDQHRQAIGGLNNSVILGQQCYFSTSNAEQHSPLLKQRA